MKITCNPLPKFEELALTPPLSLEFESTQVMIDAARVVPVVLGVPIRAVLAP